METRYDKFEFFKNSLSSLKETSKDSDSKEISYMTESDLQVVNFDKVKEKYAKKWIIKVVEGLPKLLRVFREGLA